MGKQPVGTRTSVDAIGNAVLATKCIFIYPTSGCAQMESGAQKEGGVHIQ